MMSLIEVIPEHVLIHVVVMLMPPPLPSHNNHHNHHRCHETTQRTARAVCDRVRDVLRFGATCRAAHRLISSGNTAKQLWSGFDVTSAAIIPITEEDTGVDDGKWLVAVVAGFPSFILSNSTHITPHFATSCYSRSGDGLTFKTATKLISLITKASSSPMTEGNQSSSMTDLVVCLCNSDVQNAPSTLVRRVMDQIASLPSLCCLELLNQVSPHSAGLVSSTTTEHFKLPSSLRCLSISEPLVVINGGEGDDDDGDRRRGGLFMKLIEQPTITSSTTISSSSVAGSLLTQQLVSLSIDCGVNLWDGSKLACFPNVASFGLSFQLPLTVFPNIKHCFPSLQSLVIESGCDDVDELFGEMPADTLRSFKWVVKHVPATLRPTALQAVAECRCLDDVVIDLSAPRSPTINNEMMAVLLAFKTPITLKLRLDQVKQTDLAVWGAQMHPLKCLRVQTSVTGLRSVHQQQMVSLLSSNCCSHLKSFRFNQITTSRFVESVAKTTTTTTATVMMTASEMGVRVGDVIGSTLEDLVWSAGGCSSFEGDDVGDDDVQQLGSMVGRCGCLKRLCVRGMVLSNDLLNELMLLMLSSSCGLHQLVSMEVGVLGGDCVWGGSAAAGWCLPSLQCLTLCFARTFSPTQSFIDHTLLPSIARSCPRLVRLVLLFGSSNHLTIDNTLPFTIQFM